MGGNMTEDWAAVWSHLTFGRLSHTEILWRVIFRWWLNGKLITRWQGAHDIPWNCSQLVPIEFKSGPSYVKHTIVWWKNCYSHHFYKASQDKKQQKYGLRNGESISNVNAIDLLSLKTIRSWIRGMKGWTSQQGFSQYLLRVFLKPSLTRTGILRWFLVKSDLGKV